MNGSMIEKVNMDRRPHRATMSKPAHFGGQGKFISRGNLGGAAGKGGGDYLVKDRDFDQRARTATHAWEGCRPHCETRNHAAPQGENRAVEPTSTPPGEAASKDGAESSILCRLRKKEGESGGGRACFSS